MLTWIILIVAVVIAAVLGIAATKPKTFSVVRERDISAPPQRVHALVNDFHEWAKWSPWEKLDPNLQRTHEGAAEGKGAVYAWAGNKKVGEGRMEITGTAPSHIDIDLRFIKPFAAHNKTVFSFSPAGAGTHVRWEMTGQSPFMFRVMSIFTNMDAMIGKDFEKGLANMKEVAEA